MKRENVKYVEVFNCDKWRKRIFIEKCPNDGCLCVDNADAQNYLNYENYHTILWAPDRWREIKEPEYVPYESWEEFKNKLSDGWAIIKVGTLSPDRVVSIACDGVYIARGIEIIEYSFEEFFECYKWLDGTPCGKLKED